LISGQDPGAFAIAQALKANEDVALTSINLASNFITKLGQVMSFDPKIVFIFPSFERHFPDEIFDGTQSALTDASDHVLEMSGKELSIFF